MTADEIAALVRDETANRDTEIAALESALDTTRDELGEALIEIARLQAIIEPPPPPVRTMSVGAIVGPQCHTIDQFVGIVGPLGVRRYFSNQDFDLVTNNPSLRGDLGKWDRIISYKPPTMKVDIVKLYRCLDSIPQDGRLTVIMCQNEPERNDKGYTAAQWVPYVNDFIDAVVHWCDTNSRDDVLPGWSFSYWRPLTDPTIDQWWPTSPNRHRAVFGIQAYDPNNRKTLEQQTKTGVDRWRAAGGQHWMLSELGTHRTGTDAANWLTDGLHWAATYGCLFAAYYDDVIGKDGPWCVNDPALQTALRAVMPGIPITS